MTIDTQNDFTLPDSSSRIEGTMEVVPQISRLLSAYRRAKLPIIHVIRLYEKDGSNADICRKEIIESGKQIVAPGTKGADLVDGIKPEADYLLDSTSLLSGGFQQIGPCEWVMYKPRWGAFYRTGLEVFLRNSELDTIVFSGCNFPNCPRTSMYQGSERDFKVVMVSDAMSGVYEKGLSEMQNIGVSVKSTEEVCENVEQLTGGGVE
ncbi:cysteine hydrolase family protein [Paenibacillus chitinolyticus]|uniref:cysteine hydrolase family protein n=1 Tax=Paenibacillus chitinolyticus TaxID=79263 RepID=UPI00295E3C91|nr:cysteine hydrolase [Paenibacillus chitinolyticus]